ncbi:nuclear transport factor 2-like isoform X2 [Phragmites australis]|uniref:nuclear transport factor 2-like isoform X2 n=1 Tax=Phragmites australis TaxID=29695 RepID=UPI002D77D8A7|nr:nuclear transport factor 2-like isoform X2 [Phragmites australis]
MAGQAGNPVNHPISPHVISGAFVQQYYHILHEQPEQVHKFYQDSSIIGRPDSSGTMVSVTTLVDINEKIMSMDFTNCLTEIETADAQLSHKDGVLIAVTGSLTSSEGLCRRFTQSFFLAPQESGGYFVLNDVFRFISERQLAEINQVVTQGNESSQNVRSGSETCSALPEPIPADKSLISDHLAVENVTEGQVINPSVNGTAIENNVTSESPVQVVKEDPKKAPVAAPPPPASTQADVPKKSYASIVKVMKEGPPTPPAAKATPSVVKHKPAPKSVTKPVEGPEKSSAKPTQSNETTPSDDNVAENDSSRNGQGYSVFVKSLPFNADVQMVEEEFKKFGAIKPGGIQVRHDKADRFCFGFIEYVSQQSRQAAIEASPVHMGQKEVYVEEKRTTTRVVNGVVIARGDNGGGSRFQSGRGEYRGDNFRGRGSGFANSVNYRSGDNYNRGNDENFNRRNDENFNRRNDGENFNSRNDENFNRRNGGENFNHRSDGGENFNRRSDGENFNRRNDFRNRNDYSGHGRGPPPGNGYHHNGNAFHPSGPFQNGNGRFPRGNGPKQPPVAA